MNPISLLFLRFPGFVKFVMSNMLEGTASFILCYHKGPSAATEQGVVRVGVSFRHVLSEIEETINI